MLHSPPNTSRRRAFTLIELLVVVSLIVMLIALLLPALGHARDTSRQTSCASNLAQLASAATAFSVDHDRLLPYNDTTLWVSVANSGAPNYWDPQAAGFVNNYFWRTMEYLGSAAAWDCAAAEPVKSVEWDPACPGPAIAMMANIYTIGVTPDANTEFHPKHINHLPSPSNANTFNDWGWKGNSVWSFRAFPGNYTPIPQPGPLHYGGDNAGVNVAFADGHARFFGGADFAAGPGFYIDYPVDRWWKYGAIAGALPP